MRNTVSGALVLSVGWAYAVGWLSSICLFVAVEGFGLSLVGVLVTLGVTIGAAFTLVKIHKFCARRIEAFGMACYEKGADIALDEAVRLYSE